MPLIHRFRSEYSPQAIKSILESTINPYSFFPGVNARKRLFYTLKGTRFALHCYTEDWGEFKFQKWPVCFRGSVRPTETGSVITGTFLPLRILLVIAVYLAFCVFICFAPGDPGSRTLGLGLFGISYLFSVICMLPDTELEKMVTQYIEDNLLCPTKPEQNQPSS